MSIVKKKMSREKKVMHINVKTKELDKDISRALFIYNCLSTCCWCRFDTNVKEKKNSIHSLLLIIFILVVIVFFMLYVTNELNLFFYIDAEPEDFFLYEFVIHSFERKKTKRTK